MIEDNTACPRESGVSVFREYEIELRAAIAVWMFAEGE
jgi:hypothetical protein